MTDFSSMTSREIFDAVKAQEDVALIAEAITALSSRRGDDISGFIGYLGRGSSDEGLIRLTLDSLKQRPDNTALNELKSIARDHAKHRMEIIQIVSARPGDHAVRILALLEDMDAVVDAAVYEADPNYQRVNDILEPIEGKTVAVETAQDAMNRLFAIEGPTASNGIGILSFHYPELAALGLHELAKRPDDEATVRMAYIGQAEPELKDEVIGLLQHRPGFISEYWIKKLQNASAAAADFDFSEYSEPWYNEHDKFLDAGSVEIYMLPCNSAIIRDKESITYQYSIQIDSGVVSWEHTCDISPDDVDIIINDYFRAIVMATVMHDRLQNTTSETIETLAPSILYPPIEDVLRTYTMYRYMIKTGLENYLDSMADNTYEIASPDQKYSALFTGNQLSIFAGEEELYDFPYYTRPEKATWSHNSRTFAFYSGDCYFFIDLTSGKLASIAINAEFSGNLYCRFAGDKVEIGLDKDTPSQQVVLAIEDIFSGKVPRIDWTT